MKSVLLIALVLVTAGCVSQAIDKVNEFIGGACFDIQKELSNSLNATCKCVPNSILPPELQNKTDIVEPKCYCGCEVGGQTVTINVAQSK